MDNELVPNHVTAAIGAFLELASLLTKQQMAMLGRWAAGDDTTSVATAFAIPIDDFEKMKEAALSAVKKYADIFESTDEQGVHGFLLELLSHCSNCQKSIDRTARFCDFCGQPNSLFDESTFFQSMGNSVQEHTKSECEKGHPSAHANPEFWDETSPYCMLCGQRALS